MTRTCSRSVARSIFTRPVFLALVLATALAGVFAWHRSSQAAPAPIVIKIATLVPKGSTWFTILQEMGEDWKTASNGQVTVRFYPGGVAGDDGDLVRKMRLGTIDGGLLSLTGLCTIDRTVDATAIPMLYDNMDEMYYVLEKMAPDFEKSFEAKGFVALNWVDAGWVYFFTKTPVKTPEDLKGMKIFSWGDDPQTADLWKAAGFNPVPLPSTEISTGLQTGLVTALPTTPEAASIMQWNQHAPYMTSIKWAPLIGGTVISKKTWETIPADLRPKLLDISQKAGLKLRAETAKAEESAITAMKARGLTVVQGDDAAWKKSVVESYPRFRGRLVPDEAFDRAVKLHDEYLAQKSKPATPPAK